jgi:hypothetical protein
MKRTPLGILVALVVWSIQVSSAAESAIYFGVLEQHHGALKGTRPEFWSTASEAGTYRVEPKASFQPVREGAKDLKR